MGGPCERCGGRIDYRSEAVICTHFGALPTLSHRICAQRQSPHVPDVGLTLGVGLLPMFLIINILNMIIGIVAIFWGIFEMTQPQESFASSFPIGLIIGPFMVTIGGVLTARCRKLSKRLPKF